MDGQTIMNEWLDGRTDRWDVDIYSMSVVSFLILDTQCIEWNCDYEQNCKQWSF